MNNTYDHIMNVLKTVTTDIRNPSSRRIFLTIPRDELIKTINIIASELGGQHLSTITAVDTGTSFEVLYHFFLDGIVITVRTSCPKEDPTVETITNVFPGAILYEREIHDILGIVPTGHPDLRRLVLPDDWVGGFPLRKDWKQPEGEG
jgi:NADH:ubiquinone oxidoreductase subunit C